MSVIFEVRRVVGASTAYPKWKISSSEVIDCDLFMIINNKIKDFKMVATSVEEDQYFIYEITFHRSVNLVTLRRMFPGVLIEPIRQLNIPRILVYYCRETNSYIPYDDPSM